MRVHEIITYTLVSKRKAEYTKHDPTLVRSREKEMERFLQEKRKKENYFSLVNISKLKK